MAYEAIESLGLYPRLLLDLEAEVCQTITDFYIPTAFWIQEQTELGKKKSKTGYGQQAVCLGMNIPHGIDTYPLNICLTALLNYMQVRSAIVSYEDFYVDDAKLSQIKTENPYNRFVQHRGLAGTHDIALGSKVMNQILNCH